MSGTQKQTRWNFPPALRHATFRLYYGGLVFSSFGNNFTQLAITWQMYEMTGSALQLGLLGLSRAFTSIPVLLFGGLLADAIDRRRLMMATQAGQLGVTVMLLSLSAMAAWLGPEIAVLAGGVSVLAIVFLIGLGVPMVRRYTLEPDAVVAQDDQPADGSPPTNPRSAALPR